MEKNSKVVIITLGSLAILSGLIITIILIKDKFSTRNKIQKNSQVNVSENSASKENNQNKIDVFSGKKPLTFGEFVKKEKENDVIDITIEDYQEYLRKGDAYEF